MQHQSTLSFQSSHASHADRRSSGRRAVMRVITARPLAALAILSVLPLADTAAAQVFDLGGGTNSRGWHQPSGRRNMARSGKFLYAAVVTQNGAVQIRRKVDDTVGNWSTLVAAMNTLSTGIGTSKPTTSVALAVSKSGCLHVTWGRYYYPSFFKQYYRAYHIGSGFPNPSPQDITALVGASSSTRTDSMAIAVGPKDTIFLTAPIKSQSWRSQLLQSKFVGCPPATGTPDWYLRGGISGNTASSQNVRMVVDTTGKVQLAFYNNTANGRYATRVFSQPSTWGTMEFIGTPPFPRDDAGYLATDFSRFTHVVYKHLVSKVGTLTTYQLLYRRRFGTTPWSAPIAVDTFTNVDHGTDNPRDGYAIAATQKGDRVFVVYRDYKCKRLMVKQKKYAATSFEFLAELQPKSTTPNDYYMPSVRNTLFPTTNGLVQYLDISYRRPAGSTYRLIHQRLQVGAMNVDQVGCAGTNGVPAMTYGGVPCSPNPHTVDFGLERAKPGAMAFLLYEFAPINLLFAGCNLYATNVLAVKTVNACNNAKASFNLPSGCFSVTVYNQWAVVDSGATGGWAMSNRGKIIL
jgi:hypothetical protein